jgi:hypothetical protein
VTLPSSTGVGSIATAVALADPSDESKSREKMLAESHHFFHEPSDSLTMPRKSNKNAPYEGSSSFSVRSNDAKELTKKFRSNQLELYGGPKEFLNDPQNSYWKKYDADSFANGWQRCRIKALTDPDPELMGETAELGK